MKQLTHQPASQEVAHTAPDVDAHQQSLCGEGQWSGRSVSLVSCTRPAQPAAPPMGILPPGMQGMLGGRGGMVGALPYGGIGQIPEHAEGQVGHNGQVCAHWQLPASPAPSTAS